MSEDRIVVTRDRRQFLRGLGGFALALPLLPSLFPRALEAQGMPRKRFAQFCTFHGGLWHRNMFPATSAMAEQRAYKSRTARRAPLTLGPQGSRVGVSPILSAASTALTPALVAKMNAVAGLDIPFYIAHNTGSFLGNYARNDGNGGDGMMVQSHPRATIDQHMAWSPEFYGATTVRKRVMIVGNRLSYYWSNPSTRSGPVQQIDGVVNSLELFDQVFGPLTPGPARTPIVDRVLANYRRLRMSSARLSADDRRRLDEHMQGLSELERRLMATVSCGSLTRPATGSIPIIQSANYPRTPADQAQVYRLYNDVIALAFACGASRIAVVGANPTFSTFAGDWHQDIAHKAHLPGLVEQVTIADAHQRFFENVFLDLATKLEAITEGSGTVLDNTLLAWSQESGNVTHDNFSMPLVTFGSAAGALRTGSFIDFRETAREIGSRYQGTPEAKFAGLSWNQWLANAITAMGIPRAQWEEPGGGCGLPFVGADYRAHYPAAVTTALSEPLPYLLA
ncbi:MAG: DUF1552 domain-containing protein [Deltaproteobacteria bacterium]|nr:DUF1552 domain-containing protein [Deltaproteobacteria bacterium]